MENYSITNGNSKTGPITTTYSHKGSCPDTCRLKVVGCYAKYNHTGRHWQAVTDGTTKSAVDWKTFIAQIKACSTVLWRHNVAGDLDHSNGKINKIKLRQLINANKGKRGFLYTHHLPSKHNIEAIAAANNSGLTINQSVDNPHDAATRYKKTRQPVVTILPVDHDGKTHHIDGVKIVVCPHSTRKVQCYQCKLCAIPDRNFIVGFPAHGTARRKVTNIASIPIVELKR